MSQNSSPVISPENGNVPSDKNPPSWNNKQKGIIGVVITAILGFLGPGFRDLVRNIAYEKWGSSTPIWLFIVLIIVAILVSYCCMWNHEKTKKLQPQIHKYSIMSFILMSGIGIVVGGSLGALLWWSIYKQPTQNETNTRIERSVEKENKTVLPIEASPTPIPQSSATPNTKRVRPRKPRSTSLPDNAEDILSGKIKGPNIK